MQEKAPSFFGGDPTISTLFFRLTPATAEEPKGTIQILVPWYSFWYIGWLDLVKICVDRKLLYSPAEFFQETGDRIKGKKEREKTRPSSISEIRRNIPL